MSLRYSIKKKKEREEEEEEEKARGVPSRAMINFDSPTISGLNDGLHIPKQSPVEIAISGSSFVQVTSCIKCNNYRKDTDWRSGSCWLSYLFPHHRLSCNRAALALTRPVGEKSKAPTSKPRVALAHPMPVERISLGGICSTGTEGKHENSCMGGNAFCV